jgi:hypothetical protein
MYKKMTLAVLFCTAAVWGQDDSAKQRMASGCGPNEAKFAVKREAHQHPTGKPEPGKALVYVLGDSEMDHVAFHIGGLITRVGFDGAWAGCL